MSYEEQCDAEQEALQQVTFRSRRKRRRLEITTNKHGKRQDDEQSRKTDYRDLNNGDADRILSLPNSFPMRLHYRESGWLRRNLSHKTRNLTTTFRLIRFSQLQSPPSEAVLALEQTGSYFASLAGNADASNGTPLLSLRIYSVPSPAALERNARVAMPVCPLVLTVPLLCESSESADESASPVGTMPVQILLSNDWSVGMAFVHHTTCSSTSWSPSLAQATNLTQHPATHGDDSLGTLVLFRLPTRGDTCQSDVVQSYKCSNVRIGGRKAFTMRNLMWETNCIPYRPCKYSNALCSSVLHLPGFLFLNDEDDGFRLTWVILAEWKQHVNDDANVAPLTPSPLSITPSRCDIITKSDEVVWEKVLTNRYTGQPRQGSEVPSCASPDIVFEAYLRIDALLDAVLSRRRDTFGYRENPSPEFFYNLISIESGRFASLVIVFGRHAPSSESRRLSSVGVFLRVDIFTQSYEEMGWVQHSAAPEPPFLRKWSNALALNRRMKAKGVGPFCSGIGSDPTIDRLYLTKLYIDGSNEYNVSSDASPEIWSRYVASTKTLKEKKASGTPNFGPKPVSGTSLFQNCELITNDAVRSAKPVASIKCRSLQTQFVYG